MKLKYTIHKSFGSIEIEAKDDKDAFEQMTLWAELPDACPVCATSIYPHFRKTPNGDYKYYELYCTGTPQHRTQLGQYKTGGLYYKSAAWEVRSAYNNQDDEEGDAPPPVETVADRLARAKDAFASVGVVVPKQKPNESDDEYLGRLKSVYRANN